MTLPPNLGDGDLLPVTADLGNREIGVRQFLNRWIWKQDRTVAYTELQALIDDLIREYGGYGEADDAPIEEDGSDGGSPG